MSTSENGSRKSRASNTSVGGSSASYRSILDYLEDNDPEMYDFIHATANDTIFSSRGKVGITFLNPIDSKWREQIRDIIDSGDVDKIGELSEVLSAHVIEDVFKHPGEFKTRADDIPNALGQRIPIDTVKSNTVEVVIKGGGQRGTNLVARLDTNFVDGSKRENLCVYRLVGGVLSTNLEPATHKYVRKQLDEISDAKKRGEKPINARQHETFEADRALRLEICSEVEFLYNKHRDLLNRRSSSVSSIDPYIETVFSLINYVLTSTDPATIAEILVSRMLPLISFTVADFYLFIEPYRVVTSSNEYLVPSYIIKEWNAARPSFDAKRVYDSIMSLCAKSVVDKVSSGAVMGNRAALYGVIEENRRTLLTRVNNPRQFPTKILECYANLSTNNAISNNSARASLPVYGDFLAAAYRADPYRKALEDEMRYITYLRFEQLNAEHPYDKSNYHLLKNIIREYLSGPSTTTKDRLKMLNIGLMTNSISPNERVSEIRTFINSTMFLFVPLTESDLAYFSNDVVMRPPPNKLDFYNPLRLILRRLNLTVGKVREPIKNMTNNQTVELLNTLGDNMDNLDPEVRTALEKLLKR